jgi:hypothetical protein
VSFSNHQQRFIRKARATVKYAQSLGCPSAPIGHVDFSNGSAGYAVCNQVIHSLTYCQNYLTRELTRNPTLEQAQEVRKCLNAIATTIRLGTKSVLSRD